MASKLLPSRGVISLRAALRPQPTCRSLNLRYQSSLQSPRTQQFLFSSRQRPHPNSPPLQSRVLPSILLLALLTTGGIYYLSTPPSRPSTLNDISFVPYTITSREAISPTSFIITIRPQTPNPAPPYLDHESRKWKWPLWSVEFKQPEVQISRHYTPIPPLKEDEDGTLRFYIRAVGDGEMSNYLCRRQVGQEVFLRGPHVGFELGERLGDKERVVFLAGGTGVVPGMQAAKAVLDAKSNTKVDILWAVRKREEIQRVTPQVKSSWKFWQEKEPSELGVETEAPSPIASRLNEMKALYGDRLKIQVVVDEEGTRFRDKDIQKSLLPNPTPTQLATSPLSKDCHLHDQKMHVLASEFAPTEGTSCACKPVDGGAAGKNILIVSGPDGFIAHYAGEKVWLGGHQTQGPLGGIAGQLQRQYPQVAEDWLVLKL